MPRWSWRRIVCSSCCSGKSPRGYFCWSGDSAGGGDLPWATGGALDVSGGGVLPRSGGGGALPGSGGGGALPGSGGGGCGSVSGFPFSSGSPTGGKGRGLGSFGGRGFPGGGI